MGRGQRARPKKLAGKLRAIRSTLGIGQVEMARRLQKVDASVYPGMISRLENGKVEPSLLVLLEYARFANISTDYLIDDNLVLPKTVR